MKLSIEMVSAKQLALLTDLINSSENNNETTLNEVGRKIIVLEKCKGCSVNTESDMLFDIVVGIREHYGDYMYRHDAKALVSRKLLGDVLEIFEIFPE